MRFIALSILGAWSGFAYAQAASPAPAPSAAATPSAAPGKPEDPIAAARRLIDAKQYDQAMAILSDLIKKDRERLDEAQPLTNRILALRAEYNKNLQEFIALLDKDPGNDAKALELIGKMSGIDPVSSKQQLEDIRILRQIKADRAAKNAIMAKALGEIQAKAWSTAIDTYLSGFGLQAQDFLVGGQAEDFRQSVLAQIATVRQSVTTLKSENALLLPALQSFQDDIKAGKDGIDRLSARFPEFAAQFLKTVGQTAQLEQAADSMTALRQRSDRDYPPETKTYNYNEHIRLIQEFMQGPSGKAGQGIRYAARSLIDTEYRDTLAALESLYAERKREFDALAARGAAEADQTAALRLVLASGTVLMRAQGLQGNADLGASPGFADIARLPAAYRAAPALVLGELRAYQQWQNDTRVAATLARLAASKAERLWTEALAASDGAATDLRSWERDTKAGLDAGLITAADYARFQAIFSALHQRNADGLLALARSSYAAWSAGQLAQIRQLFTAAQADDRKAGELLTGTTTPGKTGIYRYPDQAITGFNAVKARYNAQLGALDILDKDLGAARGELAAHRPVQQTSADSQALRREIQAATARLDGNLAKAQSNIRESQASLQRAAQYVGLADAALAGTRIDLDAADRNYGLASSQYVAAFDLAYSAEQRQAADARLTALLARIETARNNLLTVRIREFIATARNQFDLESYQAAFETISAAEELDDQTATYKNAILGGAKPEDARNAEIRYWKNRIQAASNLSSERTVSDYDPAFAVLVNYLNLARLDYNKAAAQVAAGRKADAALVNRARQNIDNVLLVKPNNWDAKLLRLQVEQISDPAAFKILLPNRVREAVDRARKDKNVAALTELQALKELDPRNQTLAQAIFDLEVELGYRDSPLTTARKNEAATLVAQAKPLVARGTQADLQRAVTLLNRAFGLNPANPDIGPLLDTARRNIKSLEAKLTYEEEQRLNEARTQYLNDQLVPARATVKALLDNHPTMAELVKLLRDIDQKLGQ